MHGLGHIRRAEIHHGRCAGRSIFRKKRCSPRAAECRASATATGFRRKFRKPARRFPPARKGQKHSAFETTSVANCRDSFSAPWPATSGRCFGNRRNLGSDRAGPGPKMCPRRLKLPLQRIEGAFDGFVGKHGGKLNWLHLLHRLHGAHRQSMPPM